MTTVSNYFKYVSKWAKNKLGKKKISAKKLRMKTMPRTIECRNCGSGLIWTSPSTSSELIMVTRTSRPILKLDN